MECVKNRVGSKCWKESTSFETAHEKGYVKEELFSSSRPDLQYIEGFVVPLYTDIFRQNWVWKVVGIWSQSLRPGLGHGGNRGSSHPPGLLDFPKDGGHTFSFKPDVPRERFQYLCIEPTTVRPQTGSTHSEEVTTAAQQK